MSSTLTSELELDARAHAYAQSKGVSYAEALLVVIDMARANAAAQVAATPTMGHEGATDAELDQQAKNYARQHGVSYSEALDKVVVHFTTARGDFAEARSSGAFEQRSVELFKERHKSLSDVEMDQAAKVYARSHSVSYSEALDCVATQFSLAPQNFAESAGGGPLEQQSIEIFRSGRHTSEDGRSIDFTQADIQAIADGYNPSVHEAPLTIGHPVHDRPAYGWVQRLHATADGRLLMNARQLDPSFAESIKAGRYKKRSASFYAPGHPNNPKPGTWSLRHVGWLGAQPPAVQGMPDARFAEPVKEEGQSCCFSFYLA